MMDSSLRSEEEGLTDMVITRSVDQISDAEHDREKAVPRWEPEEGLQMDEVPEEEEEEDEDRLPTEEEQHALLAGCAELITMLDEAKTDIDERIEMFDREEKRLRAELKMEQLEKERRVREIMEMEMAMLREMGMGMEREKERERERERERVMQWEREKIRARESMEMEMLMLREMGMGRERERVMQWQGEKERQRDREMLMVADIEDPCSRGKLFDHGLSLIKEWEANENQEVEDIMTKFLHSCATHYLEIGDKSSMMKFVQAFPSLAMKRSFLRGHKVLYELIHVEIAVNNFVEAAGIARLMGNLLFESEIVEKGGDFEQAAKLVLFVVLNKSFWGSGNNGWPIKSFSNQDELLKRAIYLSEQASSSLSKNFTAKLELLFGKAVWLKLWEVYNNSVEMDSPFFKLFSARKIVDLHLNCDVAMYNGEPEYSTDLMVHVGRMISQNTFSVTTLVYFWNLWKDQVINVLLYLKILDSIEDATSECAYYPYEDFVLEYFGVRKEDGCNIYVAHFPEASWIEESVNTATFSNNLIRLNRIQFSSCAKSYWHSEIASVGLKVLELLGSLHYLSTKGFFPLVTQGKIILYVYKLSTFLIDPDVNFPRNSAWNLQKILCLPSKYFFDIIFPFNMKSELTESMVYLRENDDASSILEDIIMGNLVKRPTYGQVGRAVMILFVTGKMSNELHRKISAHFESMSEWIAFIDEMKKYFDSGVDWPGLVLVNKLSLAIHSTYSANWVKEIDYINPHCFLYILECLLFLASSWRSAGNLFTAKSCVVEMLICSHWNPLGCYLKLQDSSYVSPTSNGVNTIFKMIVNIAHDLLSDEASMKKWLKKSYSGSFSTVLPMITLRLVMIVVLAHLNTNMFGATISNLFQSSIITSRLPQKFRQKIRLRPNYHFRNMVAEAFDAIDDPLVVMGPEKSSELMNSNVIFVSAAAIQCRNELLKVLFPKKNESLEYDHMCRDFSQASSTIKNVISTTECSSEPVPAISKAQEQNKKLAEDESKEFHGSVHCRFKDFWDFIDKILIQEFDVGKLPSIIDGTLLELEEKISTLDAALACLVVDDDQPNDDNYASLGEMKCLANELKNLYNDLEFRNKPLEDIIPALKKFGSEAYAKKSRLKSLPDLKIKKIDLELAMENPVPLPQSEQPSFIIEVRMKAVQIIMRRVYKEHVAFGERKHAKRKAGKNKGKGKSKRKKR